MVITETHYFFLNPVLSYDGLNCLIRFRAVNLKSHYFLFEAKYVPEAYHEPDYKPV